MRRWTWILVLLAAASKAEAGDVSTQETYTVERGAWLELDCPAGKITVDTWDKDQVEVVAYHDPDIEVRSRQVHGDVQAGNVGDKSKEHPVEYEIRAPAWINVGVSGNQTDVDIRGVDGRVEVDVIEGDIYVRGGREKTVLRSIKGDVDLEEAEGDMDLESTDGQVTVIDCKGDLTVGSVNGDVRCENLVSSMVDTETVNGDSVCDGAISDQGDYYFTTHLGDIDLNVPRDVNVEVSVVTYRGDFSTDFEMKDQPEEHRGIGQRRWTLRVGSASGRLRAETFQGDVTLYSGKRGRPKRG